ncbi:MAG: carotenoid biosynthesis protein [Candidatus Marinimicrobia bacterium]|nr:carotenoid biosynthesis protein [Candidatus Neomarinimicrobiota bacterium]
MDYRPEILDYLSTPATWAIAEILAFVLFFYCLADIVKKNEAKTRIFRVFELFGFIVYAGIFENIGVLGNTYNYSLDRLVMVGTVPLSLLAIEAVIFYSALRFAEVMKFPKWTIPVVVGFLAVLQDLTIDPVAVFDTHLVAGVMEGRWNWTIHYEGRFFGIPFFNYTGWFFLMFYYTALIQLGRKLYERSGHKIGVGLTYVTLSPIAGVLLIISPITRFLLFLDPIFPKFLNRSAEIAMLAFVMITSIVILIKYRKRSAMINFKKDKVIWIIPLTLHTFDIILAFSLKITIAYIPVLLFAGIHLGYLAYYYLKSHHHFKNESV